MGMAGNVPVKFDKQTERKTGIRIVPCLGQFMHEVNRKRVLMIDTVHKMRSFYGILEGFISHR